MLDSEFSLLNQNDLSGINIAVYDGGRGFKEREDSMAALYWMFKWMNASVDFINSTNIKNGHLNDYKIIVIPGGWAYDYFIDLGETGKAKIREFIANGGGYWGSCAGAFFACEEIQWLDNNREELYDYGLGLFSGSCRNDPEIAEWPGYTMTEIIMNTSINLFEFSESNKSFQIMYYGGPYFNVGSHNVTVLGTYKINNKPALIALEYGSGRVFLSGVHPEWEEDSFRDGSNWDNRLEDVESDWDLSKNISLWIVGLKNITASQILTQKQTIYQNQTISYNLTIMVLVICLISTKKWVIRTKNKK
jgi:glutamine amidotransferase-like uncharacterized protein